MNIRKRKGFNIEPVLARLSNTRTLNPDGSQSLVHLGALDEIESYLRTSLDTTGTSDAFMRSVVDKAMGEEQDLTEEKFLSHCNRIASIKRQNDCKPFKVVFPIWGGNGLVNGRRKWDDVSIFLKVSPNSSFARRARLDRNEQFANGESTRTVSMAKADKLPLAVCSVNAIDVHDAFEQGETAISKELGLLSLFASRGKFIITKEPDTPINTVLLAPHMTVHNPTGAISADMFWYNRWPTQLTEKQRSQADKDRINDQVERVRKRIRKLPWRESAEKALARHYTAFGQCDLESSFLDGWRLLESIGGHSREKSETLVKRAAWFFEDRETNYQIGLHLMHRRNLISHGRPMRDVTNEGLAFQMKRFFTPFLHAFLTNPFNFGEIEELWSFCDLPVERNARLKQARILKYGAKFRRER